MTSMPLLDPAQLSPARLILVVDHPNLVAKLGQALVARVQFPPARPGEPLA